MTTQNQTLSQFLVKRDGSVDDDYMAEILALERKKAVDEVFSLLKQKTRENAREIGHRVVSSVLDALDELVECTTR